MVVDKKISDRWIAELCLGYMLLADEARKSNGQTAQFYDEIVAIAKNIICLLDDCLQLKFIDPSRIQLVLDITSYLVSLEQQLLQEPQDEVHEVSL